VGGGDAADGGGQWTVIGAKGVAQGAGGGGRPHKKKMKRAMELAAFASTDVYHQVARALQRQ
jgi:hypothetical protein